MIFQNTMFSKFNRLGMLTPANTESEKVLLVLAWRFVVLRSINKSRSWVTWLKSFRKMAKNPNEPKKKSSQSRKKLKWEKVIYRKDGKSHHETRRSGCEARKIDSVLQLLCLYKSGLLVHLLPTAKPPLPIRLVL